MAKKQTDEEQGFGVEEAEDGSLAVNLGDTSEEAPRFEPVPNGNYNVVVDELEFGHSQASGNPMWTWRLEIEDGEYQGRKLFYHTVFNENGMPRVKRALMSLSDDEGYGQELLGETFNPDDVAAEGRLVGARCALKVGQRRYEGRMTNNVRDMMPVQASEFVE